MVWGLNLNITQTKPVEPVLWGPVQGSSKVSFEPDWTAASLVCYQHIQYANLLPFAIYYDAIPGVDV